MILILKRTISEFLKDGCTRIAAALAYYTTFSLAPLLVLVIAICGFIWDPSDVTGLLEAEIRGVVGADGAAQVKTMLSSTTTDNGGMLASVLSGAMLLIGATGLVGQLQVALNETWEVKPDPEQGGIWIFFTKRLLSLGMIFGIAFLLVVSLALSSVLSAAGNRIADMLSADASATLLQVCNVVLSLIVTSSVFAGIFKFLPDANVAWSDVIVGAILTGVLFAAGKFGIGAYLGSRNMDSVYGAAGSLALILIWTYYSAIILLFGAEFTQVWAKVKGSGLVPTEGAIRTDEAS